MKPTSSFLLPPDLELPIAKSLTLQLALEALIGCFQKKKRAWERLSECGSALLKAFGRKNAKQMHELLSSAPETPTSTYLETFSDALFPYVEACKQDENVVLYLIEQRTTLNECVRPELVERWLRRLFPKGPAPLRAMLQEGYSRRGFSDFYTRKEALVQSIGGTTDKWPPMQLKRSS
jgi:hypothetical protein